MLLVTWVCPAERMGLMQPLLAAGRDQVLGSRSHGILKKCWWARSCTRWAGSMFLSTVFHIPPTEEWTQAFVLSDFRHWDGLIRQGDGQIASRTGSEKLALSSHLSVILLQHTSCLFLSDLLEFSHENWVSCSGVAMKRELRQRFGVYWGAGKSRLQNVVIGNREHRLALDL